MAEEDCEKRNVHQEVDPEVARVLGKMDDGAANVVTKIIEQPAIQKILKQNITKQTFISGLFMSLFLIGFFQIFNAAKTVIGYGWQGDVIIGSVMVIIGSSYMVKQLGGSREKANEL